MGSREFVSGLVTVPFKLSERLPILVDHGVECVDQAVRLLGFGRFEIACRFDIVLRPARAGHLADVETRRVERQFEPNATREPSGCALINVSSEPPTARASSSRPVSAMTNSPCTQFLKVLPARDSPSSTTCSIDLRSEQPVDSSRFPVSDSSTVALMPGRALPVGVPQVEHPRYMYPSTGSGPE